MTGEGDRCSGPYQAAHCQPQTSPGDLLLRIPSSELEPRSSVVNKITDIGSTSRGLLDFEDRPSQCINNHEEDPVKGPSDRGSIIVLVPHS